RWLATADDRGIHIWETATGKELRAIYGHRGTVRDLAVSPDGRLLASAGIDNSAKCWDTGTWQEVQNLPHPGCVNAVAFSADGRRLASTCRDGQVRVWDVKSGKLKHCLGGHEGFSRGVAFSPNKNVLVSTGYDGTIRVWDAEAGNALHEPISTGRPL